MCFIATHANAELPPEYSKFHNFRVHDRNAHNTRGWKTQRKKDTPTDPHTHPHTQIGAVMVWGKPSRYGDREKYSRFDP